MLAQIGKAVTFNVNLNGAKGELKAHIDAPSGDDLEICYQEIDNHLWAIRFIPKENGVHYVAVKVRCIFACSVARKLRAPVSFMFNYILILIVAECN